MILRVLLSSEYFGFRPAASTAVFTQTQRTKMQIMMGLVIFFIIFLLQYVLRMCLSHEMLKRVFTPYIRLVKFQLVRQIPDVYVSACVLAAKLFLLFFLVLVYFS